MQKPRDTCGGRVAFVVGFVVVAANIALLSPGDFLLSGLAGAGQQAHVHAAISAMPTTLNSACVSCGKRENARSRTNTPTPGDYPVMKL